MRILGIDPALSITGYGVIEFKKNFVSLIEAGIIKTSCQQPLAQRINKIYLAVSKLISDTSPQTVVLEKLYAHYRHPTTAYLLGQARGVICLACAQQKIFLAEYAATRIKKAIIGNGLASKQQVEKMTLDILRLKGRPRYMDVTDALALAIGHAYITRVT